MPITDSARHPEGASSDLQLSESPSMDGLYVLLYVPGVGKLRQPSTACCQLT